MDNLNSQQPEDAIPWYHDERKRNILAQVISAVLVISILIWIIINFIVAANNRGLNLKFNFLNTPAGFPISDPAIPFDSTMNFSRAFLVGLLNTLRVSVIGIFAATVLGTVVALSRLSTNWLLSRIALVYIEFHRNIPLLVLLFIWYFTVFKQLPDVQNALVLPGPSYLTQRGIYLTWPRLTDTGYIFVIFSLIGLAVGIFSFFYLRRRRALTGQENYYQYIGPGIFIVMGLIGWFLSGNSPFYLDIPSLDGFNYQGGYRMTPEFGALFVGLTMYTAGFIAEVVRAGIQAVDRGQVEAAKAIGLSSSQVLTLVVIPQALRVMIPPMISQYLNLTKNSSLALAIGYQDLFSVGKIAINQAGRAVPVFAMIMVSYLSLSLITSFVLNLYNNRIQLVSR
jgi:general L-amino acid transport system permease protein